MTGIETYIYIINNNNNLNIKPNNFDNNSLDYNTPLLFKKKKSKIIIKNLVFVKNDTGKFRHYTPAAQEWYNSIYNYNSNYTKTLPVADTNLITLLKSYFSIEINRKISKARKMLTKDKRIMTKRVFVGRGDLKHTNSKVIITFNVYDTHKSYLSWTHFLTKKALFFPQAKLRKTIHENKKKVSIVYNRLYSLNEFLAKSLEHKIYYALYLSKFISVQNQYLSNLDKQRSILTKMVKMKLITEKEKNQTLINLYDKFFSLKYPEYDMYLNMAKVYYLKTLKRLKFLLGFNNTKYSTPFLYKLINLVQDIYKKKVEFNIVRLKKIHLNSDIYTEAISLKLRDRKNNVFKVLKLSLKKLNIPIVNRMAEENYKVDKDKLIVNLIRNKSINTMFKNNTNDPLNNLLLDFYPDADRSKFRSLDKRKNKNNTFSYLNYVIQNLKHMNMRGVKVEVRGRISKRFTASRSIFKMKIKGGLKNLDSSLKKISTVMLRGHVKSNIKYSFVSSKNRTGSFGIKGWVSNK